MNEEIKDIYQTTGVISGPNAYDRRNQGIEIYQGITSNAKKLKTPSQKNIESMEMAGYSITTIFLMIKTIQEYMEKTRNGKRDRPELKSDAENTISLLLDIDDTQKDLPQEEKIEIKLMKRLIEINKDRAEKPRRRIDPIDMLETYSIKAEDILYFAAKSYIYVNKRDFKSKESFKKYYVNNDRGIKYHPVSPNKTPEHEIYNQVLIKRFSRVRSKLEQGKNFVEKKMLALEELFIASKEGNIKQLKKNLDSLEKAISNKDSEKEGYADKVFNILSDDKLIGDSSIIEEREGYSASIKAFESLLSFSKNLIVDIREQIALSEELHRTPSRNKGLELQEQIKEVSQKVSEKINTKIGEVRKAAQAKMKGKYFLEKAVKEGNEIFTIYEQITPNKKGYLLSFDNKEEALDFITTPDMTQRAKNFDRLDTLKKELSEPLPVRPRDVDETNRIGENYTKSLNVPTDAIVKLGFTGIEFGVAQTEDKSRRKTNLVYDSVKDAAKVLNVSEDFVLVRGGVGLSIAGRGKGGRAAPSAHIEYGGEFPVINLTDRTGDGSLYHELVHAMDQYSIRLLGLPEIEYKTTLLTKSFESLEKKAEKLIYDETGKVQKGKEEEASLLSATKELIQSFHETDMGIASKKYDSYRKKDYWSAPHEMLARSSEVWMNNKIKEKGEKNPFLVSITTSKVYPSQEDQKRIFPKIEKYITALKILDIKVGPEIKLKNEKKIKEILVLENKVKEIQEAKQKAKEKISSEREKQIDLGVKSPMPTNQMTLF